MIKIAGVIFSEEILLQAYFGIRLYLIPYNPADKQQQYDLTRYNAFLSAFNRSVHQP